MNMQTIIGGVVGMLAIAIILMIYGVVLPNLNQTAIGGAAISMLNIVPVVAAGIGLLGMVIGMLGYMGTR